MSSLVGSLPLYLITDLSNISTQKMIVKVVVLSEVSKVEILCIFYLKSGFENTSTDTAL